MRILIVDDEAPARERLQRLLTEIEDCQVVAEAGNGGQALQFCHELHPDVVLMDISMPGMSGVEIAHHLNALPEPPAVIFTTAYDEYAVEAFETEAIGYLLKPVRKEKLARALRHAARVSAARLRQLTQVGRQSSRREHVCARIGEQLRLIPLDEVVYFLADQKYVTVRHLQGDDLIDESLKELSVEFSPDFIRIHRNALIAEKFIEAVGRDDDGQYVVKMRDCSEPLQVSRRHAAALLRRLRGRSEEAS